MASIEEEERKDFVEKQQPEFSLFHSNNLYAFYFAGRMVLSIFHCNMPFLLWIDSFLLLFSLSLLFFQGNMLVAFSFQLLYKKRKHPKNWETALWGKVRLY